MKELRNIAKYIGIPSSNKSKGYLLSLIQLKTPKREEAGSDIGGLYRENITSEFALIQYAQMSGVHNINLSTASL